MRGVAEVLCNVDERLINVDRMLPGFIGDSEFEKLDFLRISAWTKHAYEGKVRVSAKPPVAALLANNGEISLPVISGLFRYRRRVASPSSDLRKTVIHEPRVSALLFANITTLRKRASFQLPTSLPGHIKKLFHQNHCVCR